MQLLCLRTSAATTLPTTLCSNYVAYATTSLTNLCNNYDPCATTFPIALCSDYSAYDSLGSYLFNAATLPTTLRSNSFAYEPLRQLRCLRLSVAATSPTGLCSNYDPCATTFPMTFCSDYFSYASLQQLLCLRLSWQLLSLCDYFAYEFLQ